MPVIKVDLPQEVLEKLATLANRHMVATRVMAADLIATYLNQVKDNDQLDEDWSIDNNRLAESTRFK